MKTKALDTLDAMVDLITEHDDHARVNAGADLLMGFPVMLITLAGAAWISLDVLATAALGSVAYTLVVATRRRWVRVRLHKNAQE